MTHALSPLLALTCYYGQGRYSERVERTSPQEKAERMIRHWVKLLMLVLLVLIQTACPKYWTQQTNEDARVQTPDDHGGSSDGSGSSSGSG